jgi:hypothetical protein
MVLLLMGRFGSDRPERATRYSRQVAYGLPVPIVVARSNDAPWWSYEGGIAVLADHRSPAAHAIAGHKPDLRLIGRAVVPKNGSARYRANCPRVRPFSLQEETAQARCLAIADVADFITRAGGRIKPAVRLRAGDRFRKFVAADLG